MKWSCLIYEQIYLLNDYKEQSESYKNHNILHRFLYFLPFYSIYVFLYSISYHSMSGFFDRIKDAFGSSKKAPKFKVFEPQ